MHVPAELTVSELAFLLGVPRQRIVRRMRAGTIPGVRPTGNAKGHWRIPLQAVQSLYPMAWESVLLRLRLIDEGAAAA